MKFTDKDKDNSLDGPFEEDVVALAVGEEEEGVAHGRLLPAASSLLLRMARG